MEEMSLWEKKASLWKHFDIFEDVNRADRDSVSSKNVNRRKGKDRTKYKEALHKLYCIHFAFCSRKLKSNIFKQYGSKNSWKS